MIVHKGTSKIFELQIQAVSSMWSLHGFQTLHFICNQFGCKRLLPLKQNYARHCFLAFARHHLKSLCCFIQIWADALFLDRSSIWICSDSAALHTIQSKQAVLFLCHIFTKWPINDKKIEQSNGELQVSVLTSFI